MDAIPTFYNGTQFRSRLEARWACYFDLRSDAKWAYEPIDFPGWIPDFSLDIDAKIKPLLIEVKPISNIAQFVNSADGRKVLSAMLAAGPLGLMKSYEGFGVLGLSPDYTWYLSKGGFESLPVHPPDMQERWKTAGNIVQWKAPK